MKLNATPETVRATAEALKLASLLDDRVAQPDQARIAAWSEKIEVHRLTRDDLLDGLQNFYDLPQDRPIGIGDLIHHARLVKRARLEKEADEERERRQADNDVKAADEFRAVMADAIMGRVKNRTQRFEAAEEALQNCHGKRECMAALGEFFEAKREAQGKKLKAKA